jgi:hypothetical protein
LFPLGFLRQKAAAGGRAADKIFFVRASSTRRDRQGQKNTAIK